MTKTEILAKMKADLEMRGKGAESIRNYCMHVRLYQDYHNKPAYEMGETEIASYLHYLLTEKKLSHAKALRRPSTQTIAHSCIRKPCVF